MVVQFWERFSKCRYFCEQKLSKFLYKVQNGRWNHKKKKKLLSNFPKIKKTDLKTTYCCQNHQNAHQKEESYLFDLNDFLTFIISSSQYFEFQTLYRNKLINRS